MGNFDFDAFEAADNKARVEEQAQIDAQSAQADAQSQQPLPVEPQLAAQDAAQPAIAQQPDPNVPSQAELPTAAPQGFDFEAFLGGDKEEEVTDFGEAPTLDFPSAGAEPSGTDTPDGPTQEELEAQKVNALLGKLRAGSFKSEKERVSGLPESKLPSGTRATGTTESLEALEELKSMGFKEDEISAAVATKKGLAPRSIIPQATGALAGSAATAFVLGKAIPGPIDDIGIFLAGLKATAQAAGAGGGAVAGRAIQAGLDPDDETNKAELLKIFGVEGATELAAIGVGGMVQKALRGGIKGATPNAKELSELLTKKAQEAVPTVKKKVGLLPSQIAPDQPVAVGLDSIVSKGIFSQRADAQFRILQKQGGLKAGDTILDGFLPGVKSLSPEESFEVLSDIVKNNRRSSESIAKNLYNKVDDIIADNTKVTKVTKQVPTSILDDAGNPITKSVTEEVILPPMVDISDIQKTAAGDLKIIEEAIGSDNAKLKLIRDVLSKDSKLTFGATQDSLTNINEIIRESGDIFTKNRRLKAAASKLKKGLEVARDRGMDALPSDAKRLAKQARTIWKDTSDRFDKPVLKQLFNGLEKNPDAAVEFISKQKVPNIKALKDVVGDEAFDRLRKGWAEGVVNRAGTVDAGLTESGKGLLMGDSILKTINANPKAVELLLGKEQAKNMTNTARVISLIQKTDTQSVSAFRMIQIGSVLALVSAGAGAEKFGGKKGGTEAGLALAGAVLIGPKVLGLLSRSPRFAKALTEGVNAGPGTKESIRSGARIVRIVNEARKKITKGKKAAGRKSFDAAQREQETERIQSGAGQTGRKF